MDDPQVRRLRRLLKRYRELPDLTAESRAIIDKMYSSLGRGVVYYEIHDRGSHVDVVIDAAGVDPRSVEVFPLINNILITASGVVGSPDLVVVLRRRDVAGVVGVSRVLYNNGVLTIRFYR